ncbi:hypothetical protein FBEOM_10134 [Fusarium beomiforme]|uniref:Uncharacterized protein n=1 Tax=Fusarium beomiforme TaxID=44412 RepID=A0A9P5ACE0_9HYPO|nr:hypothetical protein FBEOM_10134 [Fusarium beomiforme]
MAFGSSRTRTSSEEQRGRSTEPVPLMETKQRTNSYSSEFSTQSTASSTIKASRSWFKAAPQPVNNVTYCGRHSSQFLFGGPSLADLARAMLGKD